MSNKSRVRTWVGWIWALLPLLFALPAPLCFWWAAHRLHSRAVALEAWAYVVVCGVWLTLAAQHSTPVSDAGATLAVAASVVAFVRALMLRRRLFETVPTHPDFVPVPATPAQQPVAWTPSFPGQHPVQRDPNNPATWVTSAACTGSDRHTLSLPWKRAIIPAVSGALTVAFDVRLHVYGRGLGLGIGLLLTPVFALLFARWVDGPVLYYRNWGRLHRLSLDKVTVVGARSVSLLLSCPDAEEPVRLAVAARGFSLSPAARDHLRGWLGSPSVQWAPRARALLDGTLSAPPMRPRRAQRALAILLGFVLPLAAAGAGAWFIYHRNREGQIPGVAGYRRFGGPHGKLLAVGRPWGHGCQPIRLTVEEHVPDWVYQQVAVVADEARADGINITLETRKFGWFPALLRYPPGTSPATVPRVGIFAHWEDPPHLSNGHREHIGLGWNAAVDPDGNHEDLTYAKGDLWMQVVNGHPDAVRRATRQLIAMTQGILSTTRHDSGIANGVLVDRFTPSDIAAMKLMSGCT